nr:DUF6541 family protein [uncultured Olsenella sp.]
MWSELFPAVLASCAVIFVPGYLMGRALGLSRSWSVCMAPLSSFGLIALAGILYGTLGVAAQPLTLLLPLSLLLAVLALLGRSFRLPGLPRIGWGMIALYLAMGLVATTFMFVRMLPSANAVMTGRDLAHHINSIRAFVSTQSFSSLRMGPYLLSQDLSVDPYALPGFYPSGWHAAVTLVVQMGVTEISVAINAVNVTISSFVWPLGTLVFLAWSFRGKRRPLAAGALATVSFMAFPWYFMKFGPIYPNLAGFSLVFPCVVAFMLLVEPAWKRPARLRALALFLVGGVALALTQPNAIFVAAVILVPYVAARIVSSGGVLRVLLHELPSGLVAALWVVACGLVWLALNRAPFMSDVVGFGLWGYRISPWEALVNVATLAYQAFFVPDLGQPLLALLVLLGLVWTLRNRRLRWMSVSYVAAAGIVFGNATMGGLAKQLLSGFWYSDPPRVAAVAALCAVPLAALGMDWVVTGVSRALGVRVGDGSHLTASALTSGTLAALAILVFYPGVRIPTFTFSAFPNSGRIETQVEQTRLQVQEAYSQYGFYTTRERAFARNCQKLIEAEGGADALVINNPFDGSAYAYGDAGMRVYFRELSEGIGADGGAEATVRARLDHVADDPEVRAAVNQLGARYVIRFEHLKEDKAYSMLWNYDHDLWKGIDSVNEGTPGFELVMRQGDMALYRISAA